MPNPLVSVIIPSFNAEQYIAEALESIFGQAYRPIEVVVVDDGSTDETQSVLESFKDRIYYLCQDNKGPSAARNTGIKVARGKYIAFLDSDDLWTDGKLQQQVEIMETYPDVGLLSGDMQRFSEEQVKVSSMFERYGFDHNFFDGKFYVKDAYKKIYTQGNYIPTGSVIVRRNCLEKVGHFDENLRHSEDLDLWLRISIHFKLAYSRKIWLKRRDHEVNLTGDSEAMNLSLIEVLEKHEERYMSYLTQNGINSNRVISEKYRNTGYLLLISYKLSKARRCLKASLLREFKMQALLYWLVTFLGIPFIKIICKLRSEKE